MTSALLPLPHFHSGKVRDLYEIPGHPDHLLMVASDRISTHNVTHRTLVPTKGALLTALTVFWAQKVLERFPTHLVAWGQAIFSALPRDREYPADLAHRAVVVRRLEVDPREFIWRNHLTGSLWEVYRHGKDPYGPMPRKLPKMHRFDRPEFTPTRKSENDEPVRARYAKRQYPKSTRATEDAFIAIGAHLAERGITLLDGKFEAAGGVLADEWGTGDCCRMAWSKDVQEGVDPPWLDKENFRQAAMLAWAGGPKAPLDFDTQVVEEGVGAYHEAFEAITGKTLADFRLTHFS
jgi:phosphoribosylaminoimidazole-succinocarboxamide synthase